MAKVLIEDTLYGNFLSLLRKGIGHSSGILVDELDWNALKVLANKQGLSAVVLDGVEKLPEDKRPLKAFTLQWIGETLQGFEYRYERYKRTLAEMAAFYREHGIKMMLLKGYACCIDWPKPEHRPLGDIDIWLFGKQSEADMLLKKERGIKIDNSHHHHSVFYWKDFMVENHYDFINVHHHKSHVKFEKILKDYGADDTSFVEEFGEKVYLPSPNLHALFLLKHLMLHLSNGEITLRQVLDWAFFVEKHGQNVEWNRIQDIFEEFHMTDFFGIINAICVEDLGFHAGLFPYIQFNPFMKDRVMNDIMNPQFGEKPRNLFSRIIWKVRRWNANEWKHDLCYNESRWSAFWTGVWSHLLKPSSI